MKDSIFSYYISKTNEPISQLSNSKTFGEYIVRTDAKTPYDCCEMGERVCAVFGYAVDVTDGTADGISQRVLTNSSNLDEVLACEAKLGGKYVLLYKEGSSYYLLGDATCSVPAYYSIMPGEFVCASNPMWIVKPYNLTPDAALQQIRNSGDISQAMPFDVTEYAQIKQLIPNHYLCFEAQKAIRFLNAKQKQPVVSVAEATRRVSPMIARLTTYYASKCKLYCPITSGRDSRVVLAYLLNVLGGPVESYTIRHKHHSANAQDLMAPKELAQKHNMLYRQIQDVDATEATVQAMDAYLGKGRYSVRTLDIANTIKTYYSDGGIINGDIIGQVGKCSLHRDIPAFLATPGYFRCKLHNYSSGAKKLLKQWLKEIKASGEKVNTFDLFSIENRMGRWAAQENLIYNAMGQMYLNIFNSRSIIYTWTAVERSQRKLSLLHSDLIRQENALLLEVPFYQDESRLVRISKSNGLFYYVSSYLKFFIAKIKFKKGR